MDDETVHTIVQGIAHDDGQAAKQHLAAGRAIYHVDDRYPDGVVRKHSDGRRQLVTIGAGREITILQEL